MVPDLTENKARERTVNFFTSEDVKKSCCKKTNKDPERQTTLGGGK